MCVIEKAVHMETHCDMPEVTPQRDSGKAGINTCFSCFPDLCVLPRLEVTKDSPVADLAPNLYL